jgi:hypothetical protein
MARNLLGEIPDDHWENDPGPEKETPPLDQDDLDHIAAVRAAKHDTDKYKPGDWVGGY